MWHDRYMKTGALALAAALVVLTAGTLGHPYSMAAPKAPKELKATADGPYAVDLDWKRSKNAEKYNVYRDGNRVGETERTEYRDEGLQPATTYEYRVSAIDDHGDEGKLSDPVQVTTDGIAPTMPTDLVATAVGSNRIDLEWSPSEDESGIAFYRVFREGVEVASTNTTNYEDSNLAPETTYEYRVSAVDGEGDESKLSDPASATTLSVEEGPPPPEQVTATEAGSTQIFVTWTPASHPRPRIDTPSPVWTIGESRVNEARKHRLRRPPLKTSFHRPLQRDSGSSGSESVGEQPRRDTPGSAFAPRAPPILPRERTIRDTPPPECRPPGTRARRPRRHRGPVARGAGWR